MTDCIDGSECKHALSVLWRGPELLPLGQELLVFARGCTRSKIPRTEAFIYLEGTATPRKGASFFFYSKEPYIVERGLLSGSVNVCVTGSMHACTNLGQNG